MIGKGKDTHEATMIGEEKSLFLFRSKNISQKICMMNDVLS